ncbi:MAG: DUF6140 family protein [Verrucomicrobiia bacterium]
MKLFLVTVKSDHILSGAKFTKGMSVEVQTDSSHPFSNSGKDLIAAFVRKYGIDASRLTSISQSHFDVKKIS